MTSKGKIDIYQLLSDERIQGELGDAGRTRQYSQEYNVELEDEEIKIEANNQSIDLPRYLEIDSSLLLFLGLYAGDGDKVDEIGFGQKNLHIMAHALNELIDLFGDDFEFRYHITEDTLFFESEKMKKALQEMDIGKEGEELKKQYLVEETAKRLDEVGIDIPKDEITATVSDAKGARKPGQSSREDLISLKKSKKFLPILLKLIEGVSESLAKDIKKYPEDKGWLVWDKIPSKISFYKIDVEDYIENGERCKYYTSSGKLKRYEISSDDGTTLELKKPYGTTFDVYKNLELDPAFCYISGLYLAEGGTPKELLVSYFSSPSDRSLSIEFVSTENEELEILIEGFNSIFVDFDDFINYWKIKIGSQYFPELNNVGHKIGVPILRRGKKGQGKSRSFEAAYEVEKWAVDTFPGLNHVDEFFSHIEMTGAGIARWHMAFKNSAAVLLFALMNDLTFYTEDLEQYMV